MTIVTRKPWIIKPPLGTPLTGQWLEGILGAWVLNEGGGTNVLDASGQQNGTISGAALPTWDTAKGQLALNFNGTVTSDSKVDIGTFALNANNYSVAALVYTTTWTGSSVIWSSNNSTGELHIRVNSAGGIDVFRSGAVICSSATGIVALNQWHVIAVTSSKAKNILNIFLDGKRVVSVGYFPFTGGAIQHYIGYRSSGSLATWIGEIAGVYAWNRYLEDQEIQDISGNFFTIFAPQRKFLGVAVPSGATTTKTQTGIARITATTLKTITGLGRLTATTLKNITGVSRIGLITQKTQTGIARLTAITQKTQAGISRITATTLKTITGLTRVTAVALKTISGVTRVTAITAKTITGVSHINSSSITTTKTQTGLSRITATTAKTQTGVASIASAGGSTAHLLSLLGIGG